MRMVQLVVERQHHRLVALGRATFSFGAEYTLSSHFDVFGELGSTFSHSTLPGITTDMTGSGNAWGTRTGAGVIFYP